MSHVKKSRFSPSTLAVGAIAGCGLAVALFAGGFSQAAATLDEHDEVRIGTYEPQLAFQQYHGMREFNQRNEELQREAQEAQQEGDQQRLMQIQQELQQLQGQVIEQFYNDVEQVIPKVAENAGVKIVAIEIAYADEKFGDPKDITEKLIRKVNENAGGEPEPEPDMPW